MSKAVMTERVCRRAMARPARAGGLLAWLESPARCPIPWQFFGVSLAVHLIIAAAVPAVGSHIHPPRVLSVEIYKPAISMQAPRPEPPQQLPAIAQQPREKNKAQQLKPAQA